MKKNKQELEIISLVNRMEELKNLLISFEKDVLDNLDDFPIGINIVDEKGKYLKVNAAFSKMLGYEKEELLGQHFNIILPLKEVEYYTKKFPEFFQSSLGEKGEIVHLKSKDGTIVSALYCAENVVIDNKECRMSIIEEQDKVQQTDDHITKIFERFRQRIYKLKDQLNTQELAGQMFVHDIKKPLRSVLGICNILSASGPMEKEELSMWVNTISDIMHKALEQVDTIHGINRMERGTYTSDLEIVDAKVALEAYKKELKTLLESKSIRLNLNIKKQENYLIKADPPYLYLLFSNLLSNAIEAAPEESEVNVTVHTEGNFLEFQIHNRGEVPEEIKSTFFDKYVTAGKDRGTGLGTYIAKLITETFGGKISMTSTKQEGTTVYIQLSKAEEAVQDIDKAA